MLTLFGKKKLTEDRLANVFVNALVETVDKGFVEVAGLIQDDPEFVQRPVLSPENKEDFFLIVVSANLNYLSFYFDKDVEDKLRVKINEKLALIYDSDADRTAAMVKEYQCFMSRVNHPSKNTLYAMSKAIFHKFGLNACQQEYFKSMNAPNPIFLKRLDKVMDYFIWNWDGFLNKYKVA